METILEQVLQQYGPIGMLIAFLVVGPGYTYIHSKNTRLEAENKAQELLNEFARQERKRTDELEKYLNQTLQRLDNAKDEVATLQVKLAHAQSDLEEMPVLRRQVSELMERVKELEGRIEALLDENTRLQHERWSQQQRIDDLAARQDQRANPSDTTPR